MSERRDYHILHEGQLGYNALIHQEVQCKQCGKHVVGHIVRVYIPHTYCAICGACVDNAHNIFEAMLRHSVKEHDFGNDFLRMVIDDEEGGEVEEDG